MHLLVLLFAGVVDLEEGLFLQQADLDDACEEEDAENYRHEGVKLANLHKDVISVPIREGDWNQIVALLVAFDEALGLKR